MSGCLKIVFLFIEIIIVNILCYKCAYNHYIELINIIVIILILSTLLLLLSLSPDVVVARRRRHRHFYATRIGTELRASRVMRLQILCRVFCWGGLRRVAYSRVKWGRIKIGLKVNNGVDLVWYSEDARTFGPHAILRGPKIVLF